MRVQNLASIFIITCASAFGIFYMSKFFSFKVKPEIEIIEKINSPFGRWLALKELKIYGDGNIVNVPAYEVVIRDLNKKDFTVFTSLNSESSNLKISWSTGDVLFIQDPSARKENITVVDHSQVKVVVQTE